jgi:hypothetical protein
MPTRGRNVWAANAIFAFLNQTYSYRELLILDDRRDPSFVTSPAGYFNSVSYIQSDSRSIAEKRNLLCNLASGDLVCHWDDDDWSDQTRIADQVTRLEESGKPVTGYHSMLFTDGVRAAKYINDASYALGTSLMYRRDWALAHPFKLMEKAWGEDNNFVNEARNAGELISVDAGQLMVARAHPGNTSHKDLTKQDYRPVPLSAIPERFFQ